VTDIRAVVFDWRGTLVTTLTADEWVGEALGLLGRERDADSVAHVLTAISHAGGEPSRLEADGVDCDALRHRDTYYAVFADAGLDDDLSDALYASSPIRGTITSPTTSPRRCAG
jgi:phosphoglycolate phosphatase-like HAD superfamily hydrolase